MIGIVLKSAKGFKALQLVRIQCPINDLNAAKESSLDEESAAIFRAAEEDVILRKVLGNLQALCTEELPFVAWPIGPALIQLVCSKAVVAKLFKALFAQQRTLGIRLTDLKSHVTLSPMDSEELLQACSSDILSSLKNKSGWHVVHNPSPDQAGTLLLGIDPMANADGKSHTTPLIGLEIEISGSDTVVLLVKPSTVRFRHSAVSVFSNPDTLAKASKAAEGSLCRVLPTLTPAIIHTLSIVSLEEAKKIENEWIRAGFSLPSSTFSLPATRCIVDVRFEEDEDAPTTPFPACAVVSFLGFDPVDTKMNSPGVIGALHRLQEDLKGAAFKLFGAAGGGGLVIKEMRRWDDNASNKALKSRISSIPASKGFQSAADMEAALAPPVAAVDKLGEVIDFNSLQTGFAEGAPGGSNAITARIKKPHARAGSEVLVYLARLEKEEAAAAAAVAALPNQQKKTALPPSMALAAQASKAAPLKKKAPLLGGKRALPAATEKVPKASKKAPAAGAAGAPKKAPKPAVEIDVAALDVPGLAAAEKLSTLTIPQLKAYCRSIKQPVGGKKGDLEARIKTHLGIATEH